MKRYLTRLAAAVIAVVIATPNAGMTAIRESHSESSRAVISVQNIKQHDRWEGRCSGWVNGENLTPALYLADPPRGERQLHRLAECVFDWQAPGYAVPTSIITRESGWWPWAKNPNTSTACVVFGGDREPFGSCGLSQQMARYWIGRERAFLQPAWFGAWPQVSPLDARANLIVMARMWRNNGGACPDWC